MQGKKVREAGDSDPPVPSHLILQIHPITSKFYRPNLHIPVPPIIGRVGGVFKSPKDEKKAVDFDQLSSTSASRFQVVSIRHICLLSQQCFLGYFKTPAHFFFWGGRGAGGAGRTRYNLAYHRHNYIINLFYSFRQTSYVTFEAYTCRSWHLRIENTCCHGSNLIVL